MRYTPFALTALLALAAACSNDEQTPSLVSQAQAAQPPAQNDYGWRTTPDFSKSQAEVRDYE